MRQINSFAILCLLTVSIHISAFAQSYQSNLTATGNYVAGQQLPDGAILYTTDQIDPYFGNLAAIGWLKDNSTNRIPAVEAWMSWYINHFNWPDYSGIYGTVYNYNVSNGIETPTQSYDSADAYAATFLTLAESLWNTGDAGAQAYLKNIGWYDFNVVGNVVTNLQQSDGLVVAKPDYAIKYTMDNAEDYRGLSDLAALALQAFDDSGSQNWYNVHASDIQTGMQTYLRVPGGNVYYAYLGASSPDLTKWYPDTVAQLWPINNGVIAPASGQAKSIYSQFKTAWPTWYDLSFNSQDSFPWCAVSYAALLEGDRAGVNKYIVTMQNKYVNVNPSFPWPFYSGEAGWFMRTNAALGNLP
ncbi:MAG: hypothetical protein DMG62_05725 [Acidobacteria bacterium]|nr:MAG: hypothetical protein DMG62_05725 [Acidobacteriota bacterium]